MAAAREQFSSAASPELLSGIREIARSEGRPFQEALEDALRAYIASQSGEPRRSEVMAHCRASVARHRRWYELLAQ